MQNDRVIGVILASLSDAFFDKSIQAAAAESGTIELRQANRVLSASGESPGTGLSESVQTKVANTDWEIHYHYAAGADLAEMIRVACIIAAPLLLTLLAIFVGYRRLSNLMTHYSDSVLKACKDIMTKKPPGSYPVHLGAFGAIIALVKYKRMLDYSQGPAKYDLSDEPPKYDVNEHFIKDK